MKKLILLLFFICLTNQVAWGKKKILVKVDKNTELVYTVATLADYFLVTEEESDYKKEVKKRFAKFKDHEAVKLFKEMSQDFFDFDRVIKFTANLSPIPQLKPKISFGQKNKEFVGKEEKLKAFARALRAFYKNTDFNEFYQEKQKFYRQLIKSVKDSIGDIDYPNVVENYYGIKQNSYIITISPLMHNGGFGDNEQIKPNVYNIHSYIGPQKSIDGIPFFDKQYLIKELILHEFSHPFVNPIIDKYYSQLDKYSSLLKPIAAAMTEHGYSDWKTTLYEHFVHACTIRMAGRLFGNEVADKALKVDVERNKFIYLKDILPLLEKYESERDKYKTLDEFFPVFVEMFEKLSKQSNQR